MRTAVLIALILPLTGCFSSGTKTHPYAKPNSLMRQEIQSRIANIQYQHGQELLNNMLWLQTKAGETAIVDLLAVLNHEDPKVRSSACWILGRIRDRRVIPELRPLASDKNEAVRLEAARSLVSMGDLKYVTILIEGLDSTMPSVRYNCHMALKDSTSKDFEYDHLEEDEDLRRATVLRWREWWAKHTSDPWFAASYARKHGLPSAMLQQVSAPIGETRPPVRRPPQQVQTRPKPVQPDPTQPKAVTTEDPQPTTQPKATPPKAQPKTQPKTTQPKVTPPEATPPKAQPPKTQPPKTQPKATGEETTPTTGEPKTKPATTTGEKKTGGTGETETPVFKLLELGPPKKAKSGSKTGTSGEKGTATPPPVGETGTGTEKTEKSETGSSTSNKR